MAAPEQIEILERELDRQLQLPRIANTLPQKTIEVEQRCRAKRVNVVFAVESIEHLDDGYKRVALTELEGTLQPPIKRKVFVVFSC